MNTNEEFNIISDVLKDLVPAASPDWMLSKKRKAIDALTTLGDRIERANKIISCADELADQIEKDIFPGYVEPAKIMRREMVNRYRIARGNQNPATIVEIVISAVRQKRHSMGVYWSDNFEADLRKIILENMRGN